jgi:DNA-directed RNA polymerase sigma subunit (sigma70/sigma32)
MNKDIEALERGIKFFEALKGTTQSDYEMSQQKVGEELDLSKHKVSAIEKKAMERVRKLLEKRGISADDVLPD